MPQQARQVILTKCRVAVGGKSTSRYESEAMSKSIAGQMSISSLISPCSANETTTATQPRHGLQQVGCSCRRDCVSV